ncbi:hypothetical protein GCM10025771_09820 [Niveibacterium umoris]|uniref:DUF3568 family protein n=1 Tax=Niveibacterium umoris TaxID=1193620 RepID=A0A840BPS4_9RHOO|nr:DUF3568 family protein [Niveibacterium umoris]MBB4013469.1 hypothetical protein [Niveibacterium umoris]
MQTLHTQTAHCLYALTRMLATFGAAILALALLNGCAALAVSLAGAGAGAGLSHQLNGTASRTFTEPFSKVDAATRIASKRMYLEVDEVASTGSGQVTRARVSNLNVSVELEPLSPTLTRVNVVARKDLLRVDGATAQEIVAQIERSLAVVDLAEAADAAARAGKIDNAKFIRDEPVSTRKNGTSNKKKTSI